MVADVDASAGAANATFQEAYDAARAETSREVPVLVVLGDDLILVRGETRSVTPCIPPLFHWIKSVAHAPVAVVAARHRARSTRIDDVARARFTSLVHSLAGLLQALENANVSARHPATMTNLVQIARATTVETQTILANGRIDAHATATFASKVGPWLLQATRDATALQLSALHCCARRILASLGARDREALEVVVAGAHQARARNLPMQYFQKLFGEAPGDERRVSYAENGGSVEDAVAQVGTRRLDRLIARELFHDERRLQRDVLSDAAEEQLARFDLT